MTCPVARNITLISGWTFTVRLSFLHSQRLHVQILQEWGSAIRQKAEIAELKIIEFWGKGGGQIEDLNALALRDAWWDSSLWVIKSTKSDYVASSSRLIRQNSW